MAGMTGTAGVASHDVARLARDMAFAAHPGELAGVFLRAVSTAYDLSAALCYARDATGEWLVPLAIGERDSDAFGPVPMAELENPLVYSFVSSQPYEVKRLDALIGVGDAFEHMRAMLPTLAAMHVVPMRDDRDHAASVLALVGDASALQAWRQSEAWRCLLQTYERLGARLQEQRGAADAQRRSQAWQRETERSRTRAGRLLTAGFVGTSATAKRLRAEMLRLADSSLALLIAGETGAGKDHAAWLIHQASARDGKFVPVNCAAIPQNLIEAELFGVVRGAYTGATHARQGLVAEADGGTLFLDEIGDMPVDLQSALLRLLNVKAFRPVGATREQSSDFRLICATHRSLPELVAAGRFREDLYFRIRQQALHLPPLRERTEDIPALVAATLMAFNREQKQNVAGISARAQAWLQAQPFPGNVRELRSLIQAAAEQTASGSVIRSSTLRALREMLTTSAPAALADPIADHGPALNELWDNGSLPEVMAAFERSLLQDRLLKVQGSRRLAAESLGIPKRTLARKCLAWNLEREDSTA
ncbi:sigma-54 dependent transcriptional regulator [Cupriavidus basilensis]|uniref:Sigma-54 dependent transcriptional regulator n=1 Tax=Cupriavidus basilensis TaxID=68895 RepID=A0ABT6AJ63_9BURK|nr:sigma-54 dependent transcriptional regulator [Cupriavidus basilensis]MDF3832639.1 sigma-54 dependent transcriptional regulator [Cupriavidus basilensis]